MNTNLDNLIQAENHYRRNEFFTSYIFYLEEVKLLKSQNKINYELYSILGYLALILGYSNDACYFLENALHASPQSNKSIKEHLLYSYAHSSDYSDYDISDKAKELYKKYYEGSLATERDEIKQIVNKNNYYEGTKIKIGFLSSAFRSNSAEYILLDILKLMSKNNHFDFHIYYTNNYQDDTTREFMSYFKNFKSFDRKAKPIIIAREIANDSINILVDTLGQLGDNCLNIFSLKPAPVQVSMLGYWGTSGLPQMDYLISAEGWLNENDKKSYSEQILEIPVYYHKPKLESIKIEATPFTENSYITFGCFNKQSKINNHLLNIWSIILSLVPNSKILLSTKLKLDINYKSLLYSIFESNGVNRDRITIIDSLSTEEYFHTYNKIDITLDPFPFSGGCTSADSIYMGTPIITKKGFKSVGRFTQQLLHLCRADELIADNDQEYIFKAIELANNPNKIQYYKDNLRQNMINAKILDANYSANKYQSIFEKIYEKHFHKKVINESNKKPNKQLTDK